MMFYLLDGQTPVPATDPMDWQAWLRTANLVIAQDYYTDWRLVTVFRGLDADWPFQRRHYFETIVFRFNIPCHRRTNDSWEDALLEHAEMLTLLRQLTANTESN